MVRVALQTLASILLVAGSLFAGAGRLDWPMAWALVGAFTAFALLALVLLSPALLAERSSLLARGVRSDQVLSVAFSIFLYPGMLVTCGLDRRFGWSPALPSAIEIAALGVFVAGYAFAFWAMRMNPYFSTVVRIQRDRGHRVVDRGPYGWVRHPGYAGALLAHLAIPFAVGAPWGFVPAAVGGLLLAARVVAEERTLRDGLDGYAAYAERVRWRLLPGIW